MHTVDEGGWGGWLVAWRGTHARYKHAKPTSPAPNTSNMFAGRESIGQR